MPKGDPVRMCAYEGPARTGVANPEGPVGMLDSPMRLGKLVVDAGLRRVGVSRPPRDDRGGVSLPERRGLALTNGVIGGMSDRVAVCGSCD